MNFSIVNVMIYFTTANFNLNSILNSIWQFERKSINFLVRLSEQSKSMVKGLKSFQPYNTLKTIRNYKNFPLSSDSFITRHCQNLIIKRTVVWKCSFHTDIFQHKKNIQIIKEFIQMWIRKTDLINVVHVLRNVIYKI